MEPIRSKRPMTDGQVDGLTPPHRDTDPAAGADAPCMSVRAKPVIQPRLLRVREAAIYMGLAPSTTYAMIAAGQLPSVRIGTAVRVDRHQLDRYLDRLSSIDGTDNHEEWE